MLCWLLALPLCSASCARHARGFQDLLQQRGYEKLTPPETQPVDVQVQPLHPTALKPCAIVASSVTYLVV